MKCKLEVWADDKHAWNKSFHFAITRKVRHFSSHMSRHVYVILKDVSIINLGKCIYLINENYSCG